MEVHNDDATSDWKEVVPPIETNKPDSPEEQEEPGSSLLMSLSVVSVAIIVAVALHRAHKYYRH